MNKKPLILVPFRLISYSNSVRDNELFSVNDTSGCDIVDGTHTAHVHYYNPRTAFGAVYTLDVEVKDGKVIQINFPNGGWLDDSHVLPTQVDVNGKAILADDSGRVYKIHIDR